MVNGLSNPYNYTAPNVDLGGMFSSALGQVKGGGYPGGPSFGIAPQMAHGQMNMQNALFGQETAKNSLMYNLGLSGQMAQYNRQFNPTLMDYLGLGVSGLNALGNVGMTNKMFGTPSVPMGSYPQQFSGFENRSAFGPGY